jgi:sugar phosphate permease
VCRPQIIHNKAYGISKEDLGDIDTANFFVYGLSQFIIGSMGDNFNLKIMMPITYCVQAACYTGIGLAGLNLYGG